MAKASGARRNIRESAEFEKCPHPIVASETHLEERDVKHHRKEQDRAETRRARHAMPLGQEHEWDDQPQERTQETAHAQPEVVGQMQRYERVPQPVAGFGIESAAKEPTNKPQDVEGRMKCRECAPREGRAAVTCSVKNTARIERPISH